MTGNVFTQATGKANTAAASTTTVGTVIGTAITAITIVTSRTGVLRLDPEQLGGIPAQYRAAVRVA